jgi:hypothetical protein
VRSATAGGEYGCVQATVMPSLAAVRALLVRDSTVIASRCPRYPCPGAPDVAKRVAHLLREAGLLCEENEDQGLDHGVWTPLCVLPPARKSRSQ